MKVSQEGCEYANDILLKSTKCIAFIIRKFISFHYKRLSQNKADSTVNKNRDLLELAG